MANIRTVVFAAFGGVAALAGANARAAVKLPSLFSDHMVLQSGVGAPVWGWADPGEKVSVAIAGQTKTTRADPGGNWRVTLDPLAPGGPYSLAVSGTNTLTVSDVLAGEVWIGSGQSNMGFPFKMDFFPYLKVKDYEKEKAAARFPRMRMFIVDTNGVQDSPQKDCRGAWHLTTPENVDNFSAELYFFGRELHERLGVPVGLIKSAVGGTSIALWVDAAAQRSTPALDGLLAENDGRKKAFDPQAEEAKYRVALAEWKEAAAKARAAGGTPPREPGDPVALERRNTSFGGLFNSKIAPLIPYAIRGVVWHQGENDADNAFDAGYYRYELPLLIEDWRRRWGYDFPFAWVQLANLEIHAGNWPLVREAMLETLRLPNTGMAVTIDIGQAHNIHFIDKQDVGHRLALWALGSVYARGNATSGPLPAGFEITGREIRLSFTHTDEGLVAKGGDLRGFSIEGSGGQWRKANARIEGDQVVVGSPAVNDPVAVRYGWEANPDCNLYNGAGLPASPFRTDSTPAGKQSAGD